MAKGDIKGNYGREVATRLNELLVRCDKTKADVARDIGKSQGSLTPWFTGEHSPRPEIYIELGQSLDFGWGASETARYIQDGIKPGGVVGSIFAAKDPRLRLDEALVTTQEPVRQLAQRIDALTARVDALAARFDALAARLDQLAASKG